MLLAWESNAGAPARAVLLALPDEFDWKRDVPYYAWLADQFPTVVARAPDVAVGLITVRPVLPGVQCIPVAGVDPRCHRMGIASQMLRWVAIRADCEDVGLIVLKTSVENRTARRFWAARTFLEVPPDIDVPGWLSDDGSTPLALYTTPGRILGTDMAHPLDWIRGAGLETQLPVAFSEYWP